MPGESRKGAGVELAMAVWSRRKWLAILTFAAPFSVAASLVIALPDTYQSTATVLVDRQQVPERFVQPTVTSALETRLHTISQEILSRSRLEALITRFGLYPDLSKRVSAEEVIERMRGDIKLELKAVEARGQREATVAFAIKYLGSNPQTVAQVTNTLASFYIEENLKVRERQAAGTAEFLKVQLEETKKRLDEQERQVGEFKRRYLGELPQQMETNLASLERFHIQLRLNSDNQTRATERRAALASQLAEADSLRAAGAGALGGGPEDPQTRLGRLKQELTQLRVQFSERYPDVVFLKGEIATLQQQLAEAKADSKPPTPEPATPYTLRLKEALSEVEAEGKILKGEEQHLRGAIAAYQARVDNVPRREQEFKEFSRDYESTRELYHSLLKRYGEAQIAESMEQRQKGEQFRILDPAVPPREPVARRARLFLTGLMLSFGLAAGAVVLAEQLDTSFHTVDELRRFTTVPVLASIPLITTVADTSRRQRRFRLAAGAAILGVAALASAAYFVASGNEQLAWTLAQSKS
jgi:polysaccharide chain length determinant protein (PEP-CTERM system associated)